MKQRVKLLLLLCLWCITSVAQKPTKTSDPNSKWQVKWSASDEFNSDTPDWKKWMKSSGLPNTTGWKWDNSKNAKIEDGKAVLTMRHNANNQADGGTYFKSGILKSYNTFTTGYFEAKIKGASIGKGVCPSFWLYSNFDYSVKNGETVYSEIDVVELQQFDYFEKHQDDIKDMDLNLHCVVKENGEGVWRRPKMYPETQLNKYRAMWDPRDDYHIYGCEVSKKEIIWYVDGVEVARQPNTYWHRPMNVTVSLGLRKPFVKFYDNANHAVNPLTDSDAKAALPGMPTSMYVDYIRVWEKVGEDSNPSDPATPVSKSLQDGSFESGNLDKWNDCSGNVSAVKSNASAGSYCGVVENASLGQLVELEANTTYVFSGKGKMNTTGTEGYIGVKNYSTDEAVESFKITSTNYTKGSIEFTTGAKVETYRMWFWSKYKAYADEFTLVKKGQGTTPDPDPDPEPSVGDLPTIGDLVWMKASNGKYVSVNKSTQNNLQAFLGAQNTYCVFEVMDAGNGEIALRSNTTGKYVTLSSENDILRCGGTAIFNRQKFKFVAQTNGQLALKSMFNNKLVVIDQSMTNNTLRANAGSATTKAKYAWGISSPTSSLKKGILTPTEKALNVYPNPATDVLYLGTDKQQYNIEIYTMTGMLKEKLNQVNRVDVRNFAPGLYLLKTEQESLKFVVK